MKYEKSVLLYNLFPKHSWKELTTQLLSNVNHSDIIVHISIPPKKPLNALMAYLLLRKNTRVNEVYFSLNSKKKAESKGFDVFRKKVDFSKYDIASYIHSKGTSKKYKKTYPIRDWTEMMRYFIIERLDLAQRAFEEGNFLYGVNLMEKHKNDQDGNPLFPESKFHYSGNFVTINLRKLRKEFLTTECGAHYYGVEIFWGLLCNIEKAYCVHQSDVYHYTDTYPSNLYRS